MSAVEDPFAALGLKGLCTAEEIRAAYHALAKKCHPDLNRADTAAAQAQMVRLNLAYAEAMKLVRRQQEPITVLPDAFAVAQRLFSRGMYDSALRMLNRSAARDGAWYALQGAALLKMGEAEAAHASYRAAVRLEPQNEVFRAGALEAAVRMRTQRTPIGRAVCWARRAVHPRRRTHIK